MTGTEFILWGILNFWLLVFGTFGVLFVILCLVNIHELFDKLPQNKEVQKEEEPPKVRLKSLQDRNRRMRARERLAAQRTSELINDDEDDE